MNLRDGIRWFIYVVHLGMRLPHSRGTVLDLRIYIDSLDDTLRIDSAMQLGFARDSFMDNGRYIGAQDISGQREVHTSLQCKAFGRFRLSDRRRLPAGVERHLPIEGCARQRLRSPCDWGGGTVGRDPDEMLSESSISVVEASDIADNVSARIRDEAAKQRLVFAGKQLDAASSFSVCDVQKNSIFHAESCLRVGMQMF